MSFTRSGVEELLHLSGVGFVIDGDFSSVGEVHFSHCSAEESGTTDPRLVDASSDLDQVVVSAFSVACVSLHDGVFTTEEAACARTLPHVECFTNSASW